MRERHAGHIRWLIAAVVAAGLLLPIVFGGERKPDGTGGDPWRNAIMDFQTLITGGLAVYAAYATIRQMQNSDKRSDKRHEELVRLSLRAEALEIDRALSPTATGVRVTYREIQNYSHSLDLLAPIGDNIDFEGLDVVLVNIQTTAGKLVERLAVFKVETTARLLGGSLTFHINGLRVDATFLQARANYAKTRIAYELSLTQQYLDDPSSLAKALLEKATEQRREVMEEVVAVLEYIALSCEELLESLSKLAHTYDLKI